MSCEFKQEINENNVKENVETIVEYTDELAEEYAREVGVDPRPRETISEIDETGAFIRQPNAFIQPFGDKEGDLKAEAGRYAIYWAHGCQLVKPTCNCQRYSRPSGCDCRYYYNTQR